MTEVDKTSQDLADELGVSTRMINLYRVAAEKSCGKKIGFKRGKTTFFSADEQQLIKAAKYNALDTLKEASKNFQEASENRKQETAQSNNPNNGGIQAEFAGALVGSREALRNGGVSIGYSMADELVAGVKLGIGLKLQEFIGDIEMFTETTLSISQGASVPSLPETSMYSMGVGNW